MVFFAYGSRKNKLYDNYDLLNILVKINKTFLPRSVLYGFNVSINFLRLFVLYRVSFYAEVIFATPWFLLGLFERRKKKT